MSEELLKNSPNTTEVTLPSAGEAHAIACRNFRLQVLNALNDTVKRGGVQLEIGLEGAPQDAVEGLKTELGNAGYKSRLKNQAYKPQQGNSAQDILVITY